MGMEKTIRKRGRPPKGEDDKLAERLDLRVSASEKEAFRLAASKANQDVSVWIRMQLHQAVSKARVRPNEKY